MSRTAIVTDPHGRRHQSPWAANRRDRHRRHGGRGPGPGPAHGLGESAKRPTIIAFFGDHLPPLGPVYVETGFMKDTVAPRRPARRDGAQSSRDAAGRVVEPHGPAAIGAVSPAFLPLYLLRTAGFSHPYYTGFLGEVLVRYPAIERSMLVGADWRPHLTGRARNIDPAIEDFRFFQYDMISASSSPRPLLPRGRGQEARRTTI